MEMIRITVEYRKPSKRLWWNVRRAVCWFGKNMRQPMEFIGSIIALIGLIVVVATMGSYELSNVINWKPMTGGAITMMAGLAMVYVSMELRGYRYDD